MFNGTSSGVCCWCMRGRGSRDPCPSRDVRSVAGGFQRSFGAAPGAAGRRPVRTRKVFSNCSGLGKDFVPSRCWAARSGAGQSRVKRRRPAASPGGRATRGASGVRWGARNRLISKALSRAPSADRFFSIFLLTGFGWMSRTRSPDAAGRPERVRRRGDGDQVRGTGDPGCWAEEAGATG
jgi:hypothetical protein